MKRLVIYGDSILRGITYSEQLGRHKICEGHGLKNLATLGYEVKNRCRMGATILRGTEMMERTLDECDADTTVIFEFGGNDCDHDWQAVSDDPRQAHFPNISLKTFNETYLRAIEKVRETGATVLMCNMIPIDAERYLKTISQGRSEENILAWLGDCSMLYRFQEHYNRAVERLATEADCPLIDLRSDFLLSHRFGELISKDGIHPTEAGHDLIEDSIREFLISHSLAEHKINS